MKPQPVLSCIAVPLLLLVSSGAALAAPGDLDPSFGTQGVALSSIGDEGALAMVLQADGKPLTCTLADAGSDRATLRLTRFTTAGAVDSLFGTAGVASVQLAVDTQSTVRAMLRQTTDNRLVVAGRSLNGFALTRLTTAGALDASFGSGGTAKTTISGDDEALAVAQLSDGRIVAVGRADDGLDSDFAIVRYTTTGQLDSTFSGDGIATVEFGGNDIARAVAVLADDSIVVAGSTEGSSSDVALARLTLGGALDAGFGTGGKVTTSVTSGDDAAHAVLIDGNSRVVVAGEADDDFVVVRYTSGGQPDGAFGASGIRRTDLSSGGSDVARALIRQGDDKLVAAGIASPGSAGAFALVRYTSAGALDSTFSGDGIATTVVSAIFDEDAAALALQADGSIVSAGVAEDGSTTYQMLARHLASSIATTCGDADLNGSVTSSDALRTLRFAVGQSVTCPAYVCDVDSSSSVTAGDALKVLKKAVGQPLTLACPAP